MGCPRTWLAVGRCVGVVVIVILLRLWCTEAFQFLGGHFCEVDAFVAETAAMSAIIEHATTFAARTDSYSAILSPVGFVAKSISTCCLCKLRDLPKIRALAMLR